MNQLQLAKFPSRPDRAVGLMTLDEAWYLIANGLLTIEGARRIFPKEAWPYLPERVYPRGAASQATVQETNTRTAA